jgi:hypothetical protein
VALAAAVVAAGIAVANNGSTDNKTFVYTVGLWGDMPYSDLQATTGVPNLIADMNSQDVAFTVHDGDLKAGNGTPGSTTPTTCSDALYQQALTYFNSFQVPAMFTTGDNDWTDCDRASNGGYNSLERLDHERQVFFSTPYSLGAHPILQTVQSGVGQDQCLYDDVSGATGACVENRRWEYKNVMYVTVNVQGSCNNLCDTNPDPAEYNARNTADIQWINESFAQAEKNGDAGIMLISQADPGFDTSTGVGAPTRDPKTLVENDGFPDGFHDFLVALRQDVIAYGKPVAYVHGDSHYYRVDKPLQDKNGLRIENFTRVETFGDNQAQGTNDNNWVKALVDPTSRDVFAFEPIIVPTNTSTSYSG